MNFCCLKNNEHNTDVLSTQGLIVWMSRLEISASSFIFFVNSIYTSDYISHLKEDKISFSEKIYFASKNPWILNHAKKMAYNLHKLLYNF